MPGPGSEHVPSFRVLAHDTPAGGTQVAADEVTVLGALGSQQVGNPGVDTDGHLCRNEDDPLRRRRRRAGGRSSSAWAVRRRGKDTGDQHDVGACALAGQHPARDSGLWGLIILVGSPPRVHKQQAATRIASPDGAGNAAHHLIVADGI